MDEVKRDFLQDKLNSISFKKCIGIKVGDMLHYYISDKYSWKDGLSSVMHMIVKTAFVRSYEFQHNGQPKTVCLFSNSYRGRTDHLQAFKNVSCLTENSVEMVCGRYAVKLGYFRYITLPLQWNNQMRRIISHFGSRWKLVSILYQAYMDYVALQEESKKNHWDIQYLLTYCDVMPVDSFFTQRFKREEKTCVTLQHATYNIEKNSWAYTASMSDYFLAESTSALHEAERAGYHGNMIPVGAPRFVGQRQYEQPDMFKTSIIGIVMNSPEQPREDNISMIMMLQRYCKATNKKLKLKFHPANDPQEYEQYIDRSNTETYGREISAEQFGNMVDIAIVSASSVFVTMLRQWIPCYLFVRKGHDPMLYANADEFKFTNEDEFERKLQNINTDQSITAMKNMRDYLLAQGDSTENYKKALKMIGII